MKKSTMFERLGDMQFFGAPFSARVPLLLKVGFCLGLFGGFIILLEIL